MRRARFRAGADRDGTPLRAGRPGVTPRPVLLRQDWHDVAFAHWPVSPDGVRHLFPAGTEPDTLAGQTYLGVVALTAADTRAAGFLPLGGFGEVNVRLYSRDRHGRQGVVFLSLRVDRPDVAVAGRLLTGLPYHWARSDRIRWPRRPSRLDGDTAVDHPSRLEEFLTARWGLHLRRAGRTWWLPLHHPPWRLYRVPAEEWDGLGPADADAAGGAVSVLWSPGVRAWLGCAVPAWSPPTGVGGRSSSRQRGAVMAQPATSGMPEPDVVDLLLQQHALIHELFTEAETSSGEQRRQIVRRLIQLLAVHETAEEEIVHPLARRAIPEGSPVVDDRLGEEHDAKRVLARLDGMDTEDAAFLPLLDDLRQAVLHHARSEERYEFNWLRQRCSPQQLQAAARAVRAAEAVAPTHPHAGAESAGANVLAGPVLAVTDRVRDAIRKTRHT